jgi:hypothetical protein
VGNESGILNMPSLGVTMLICEGQILMNDEMIRLHQEHCKNPKCPAKEAPHVD